jgi:hypothetical protein
VAGNVLSPQNFILTLNTSKAMTYHEDIFDLTIGLGSVNVVVMPITTDVKDNEITDLSIYPNPVSNFLQLDHIGIVGTVRILNHLGQVVIKKTLEVEKTEVDVSHLPEGMYTIQVISENGVILSKQFNKVR